MDESSTRNRLQAVSRAVSVLFAFSADKPGHTLDSLASTLDLNKPSLLRVLWTLVDENMLERHEDRYYLGPRVMQLANVFLSTVTVRDLAHESMAALADQVKQTVSLAVLDDLDVVYLAIERARTEVGIQGSIGGRHPAHATSLGKALLSCLDPAELKNRLAGRKLARLTPRTIVDPDGLLLHLAQIHADRCAVDDEERAIGVRCVAMPIFDHEGNAVAAMSVSGPTFNMPYDALDHMKARLAEATDAVSRRLGFRT
ncbi:MAG: IclR family transcriptional regulator [Trueperaceae bacterium]